MKNDKQRGMIPRSVEQIFLSTQSLIARGWQYRFEASFLEIYQETIRDLLGNGKNDVKHEVKMADKNSKEVIVTNVTTVQVHRQEQVSLIFDCCADTESQNASRCKSCSTERGRIEQLPRRNPTNVPVAPIRCFASKSPATTARLKSAVQVPSSCS